MSQTMQTSSTPSTVSGNQGGEEEQSPSPEVGPVAVRIVIAYAKEDGLSYVQRLMAMGGPVGMAGVSHTGTVLPASSQPRFTPQLPVEPNPIPPFLPSDMPIHAAFLHASQLAHHYSGCQGQGSPANKAPALEPIVLRETVQTS